MTVADLVAPALAVALSPLTIIPALLVLFTPRPRATGPAFLVAWFVGIAVVAAVFATITELVALGTESSPWVSWLRVAIGLGLIVAGVRKWTKRREGKGAPAWMRGMTEYEPFAAARTGLVLAIVNPKVLAFSAAAGLAIGADEPPFGRAALLVLAFAALASSSVALPVLASLVFGARLEPTLKRVDRWLDVNNAVIMAVLFVVIGLLLGLKGVGALL